MVDEFKDRTVVLVFAKYPKPGAVMTRLCPPLTPADAARVQTECLKFIWSKLEQATWCHPILVATPDDATPEFAAMLNASVPTWPQGQGDLGERLERASKRAFDGGARSVIFLGADSPMLDWDALSRVPEILEQVDVAVGPCADGGYYYIAARKHVTETFRNINWGTSNVLKQTCDNAEHNDITIHVDEMGYDIDRVEDLHSALADLESDSTLASTIREVFAKGNIVSEKEST